MSPLDYVKAFNEFLWNSFLMYALLGVGIFYTVYLGFPQLRHLNLAFKYAFGPIFKKRKPGETKVNSFQALATAVALRLVQEISEVWQQPLLLVVWELSSGCGCQPFWV